MSGAPELRADPYGRAVVTDPYPFFSAVREAGPAVWLPRRKMWAIGRFDDVRAALRAHETLVSGKGVAGNAFINKRSGPITLTADGADHDRRRKVLIQPVMPPSLAALRERIAAEADGLVARLATGREFEAIGSFAAHLPVTIVAELVGLNAYGQKRMLDWAAATFNALGAMNWLGLKAVPQLLGLLGYIGKLNRDAVMPGGWAARLFDAAERGELSRAEANAMVIDYVGPALDTTILAAGHMLWRLAVTPGAYDALKADPKLIPGIVNESVRLASPIKSFTRYAAADHDAGGTVIPKGSRVAVLFASANRDARHYDRPDDFDVTRNPRDHVGWGHGPHVCVGMHLARLEMELLLEALVKQVSRIEVGAPKMIRNNVLQGFAALPATFHP
ncbi:MAG: cytochrome P450 [Micropepsaceae bacterium]